MLVFFLWDGVFVEGAIASAAKDTDVVIQEEMEKRNSYFRQPSIGSVDVCFSIVSIGSVGGLSLKKANGNDSDGNDGNDDNGDNAEETKATV